MPGAASSKRVLGGASLAHGALNIAPHLGRALARSLHHPNDPGPDEPLKMGMLHRVLGRRSRHVRLTLALSGGAERRPLQRVVGRR
jgi:hypothetical protein